MGYGLRSKKQGNFPSGNITPSTSGACVVKNIEYANTPMARSYPVDAILHWDADVDTVEKAGFGHDFQSLVLGNQYQLQADGSTVNIGATMPVDTIGGEKWLRSCGAVTNLWPSTLLGATGISSEGIIVEDNGDASVNVKCTGTNTYAYIRIAPDSTAAARYARYIVKKGTTDYVAIRTRTSALVVSYITINLNNGSVNNTTDTTSVVVTDIGDGWYTVELTRAASASATWVLSALSPSNAIAPEFDTMTSLAVSAGDFFYIKNTPFLTATSHPVPYTPPGTTMPASNATTTNGSWFSLPDGSPLWQALDGKPDGVELVSNGDFDSAEGWALFGNGVSIDNGNLVFLETSIEYRYARQSYAFVPGSRYRYRVDGINITSGTYQVAILGGTTQVFFLNPINGVFEVNFTAIAGNNAFEISRASGVNSAVFDNISIQRIQPQPLTLATRVRMGVGSGDLPSPNSGTLQIVSQSDANRAVQYCQRFNGNANIIAASDTTSFPEAGVNVPWSRNAIIRRFTQVNSAGTQFRVGYAIEGTHTTIQWSSWVNFDGSFGPSTLYRLLLGFNNAYPMWFNKITAWRKQVSDAEIMEALS